MKHFEEIFFFVVLGWFIWVIMGPNGDVRIDRTCTPVAWMGDGVTSIARAMGTDYGKNTRIASENIDYRCKMTVWDFFYRSEWQKTHPGQKINTPRAVHPSQN
ncbi:hypothetical protein HAP94_02170 [Acidithiobacillus ferrivorans]|nr:hypothetical protein [Acidithiobacillus ferrivorans]